MMLSFSVAQQETLHLPPGCEGNIWLHQNDRHEIAPHRHAELEFNLITRGRATYLLGDQRHEMRRGTLLWLFPAQDHVLIDKSPDFAMWIAVFTPTLIAGLCSTPNPPTTIKMLTQSEAPARYSSHLPETVLGHMEPLMHDLKAARADPLRCKAGLGYLLLSVWEAHRQADDAPVGRGIHPAVERAARLLRDETDPFSLDELGRRAGLSASRLSRLFHAQTGQSIVEFRNRCRIERYLRLYKGGERSRLDAALDAGFGSYPQFHRVFKEIIGCRPSDYDRC